MNRLSASYQIDALSIPTIKLKMLNWANRFSIAAFLDSNHYAKDDYGKYECLVGAGDSYLSLNTKEALDQISTWHQQHQDWLFGHLNYDYKNQLHSKLSSRHKGNFEFPVIGFFNPEVVCFIPAGTHSLIIESLSISPEKIYEEIIKTNISTPDIPVLHFEKKINHPTYINIIEQLRNHIREGDCYEINFCVESFVEKATIHPTNIFRQLNQKAQTPFACYYKWQEQYTLCSSPERYICKRGSTIIAQPIKGTLKRSDNATEDEALKNTLTNSIKDKAENVMIVDLMRNDLAKTCEAGSIQVPELCKVYSFKNVHQMISTITGKLAATTPLMDVIKNAFPMGSMTGAPKVKVMQLIDQYETAKRELFSGSIGYVSPQGDMDFNVMIRSLFYNATTSYLSYQTGGAITYDSVAEDEWEELVLKAYNMETVFS